MTDNLRRRNVKKTGVTDYEKWNKFNPKDYGVDDDENDQPIMSELEYKKQEEKYLNNLQAIEKTKRRIAELEKQTKEAGERLMMSESYDRKCRLAGLVGILFLVFFSTVLPTFLASH